MKGLFTVVLFGASSSQAVHPERRTPAELAELAGRGLLTDARDLVLASRMFGARVSNARAGFEEAKEKLAERQSAPAVRLMRQSVLGAAPSVELLQRDLSDAFDFLVAVNAAREAGADVRDASDIFTAATEQMGAQASVFVSSWERLAAAVAACDAATAARYGEIVKALGGSPRALDLIGGA